ncbi:MAG: hypothetical protein QXY78_05385 [Thermoplasmata archaeon]
MVIVKVLFEGKVLRIDFTSSKMAIKFLRECISARIIAPSDIIGSKQNRIIRRY